MLNSLIVAKVCAEMTAVQNRLKRISQPGHDGAPLSYVAIEHALAAAYRELEDVAGNIEMMKQWVQHSQHGVANLAEAERMRAVTALPFFGEAKNHTLSACGNFYVPEHERPQVDKEALDMLSSPCVSGQQ